MSHGLETWVRKGAISGGKVVTSNLADFIKYLNVKDYLIIPAEAFPQTLTPGIESTGPQYTIPIDGLVFIDCQYLLNSPLSTASNRKITVRATKDDGDFIKTESIMGLKIGEAVRVSYGPILVYTGIPLQISVTMDNDGEIVESQSAFYLTPMGSLLQ